MADHGCGTVGFARLNRLQGIFVPTRQAQRTLELLKSLELRMTDFKLQRVNEMVGIPLVKTPTVHDEKILTRELGSFQIRESWFQPLISRPKDLREAVRGVLPSRLSTQLPRSLDLIGDIAIIELSPELAPYSVEVGEAVLRVNPHVRLVLRKSGDVTGRFRTRGLEVVTGSGPTETVHHEFGCRYHLDVSSVYFNPRLAHERRRVAEQVKEGEAVVDMFAGVGPYSVLIAKYQPHSRVYAVDLNPSAVKYLKENVLANEVPDRVIPLLGDAREFSLGELRGTADRVIMNLPSEAEHYLDSAVKALKRTGGLIHFYEFINREASLNSVAEKFRTTVLAAGREVRSFRYSRVIREIAPSRVQVALDAEID